jgi:hypothetical protein
VKIVKNERDPPLFTGKLLIKFLNILRNTPQVIVRHRICLHTDGYGETSISPNNFVAGGIITHICVVFSRKKNSASLPNATGAIQGSFHQSLVAIGPVVSEEKILL